MKATANQILIAASNILSGILAANWNGQIIEAIDKSISAAQMLADNIPDDSDCLEDEDAIRIIIKDAFQRLRTQEVTATLLTETIRATHHMNRNLATAYVQQAARLGFIHGERQKESKRTVYTLTEQTCPNDLPQTKTLP